MASCLSVQAVELSYIPLVAVGLGLVWCGKAIALSAAITLAWLGQSLTQQLEAESKVALLIGLYLAF